MSPAKFGDVNIDHSSDVRGIWDCRIYWKDGVNINMFTEFIPMGQLSHNYYTNPYQSDVFDDFDIVVPQVSFYLPGREAQSALRRDEVQNIAFNGRLIRQEWVMEWGVDGIRVTDLGS